LRQDYENITELDTAVVVVGPEEKDSFRKYWDENKLPFIGLPDPDHTVLKLFGQEVNLFKLGRMPAQVVVDKKGVVRYAHFGHKMSDIPPNAEMVAILEEINKD
jgi:peroxiredoxin